MATSWTLGLTSTKDKIFSRFHAKSHAVGVQVFGTMIPSEQHFVQLASTGTDPQGQPVLEIHARFDQPVLDNMAKARQHLVDLMEVAGYRATVRPVEPQLRPGVSAHYGGTVRMHRSREFGVIDSYNRIFDAQNVAVCDASAFTTGVEKNPTLTAMALAVRAAEQLVLDLRSV